MRKHFLSTLLLAGSLSLGGCVSHSVPDGNDERLMRLAADVEKRGDPVTAAALYERAANQPGAGVDVWLKLGQTRLDSNDARGAERAFQQALELAPDNAKGTLGLGTAQLHQGKLDRAISALTQAANMSSEATAYNRLGIAQILRGQSDAAQAAFKESLRLVPGNLDTQANLALAYALNGQSQLALSSIRKVSQSPRAQARHQRNELLVTVLAGRAQDVTSMSLDEVPHSERRQLLVEAQRIKAIADPQTQARELGLIATQ
jgi:Flp pilus assembly protein TadD